MLLSSPPIPPFCVRRPNNLMRPIIPWGWKHATMTIRAPNMIRSTPRPVPPKTMRVYSDRGMRMAAPSTGPHTDPSPPRTVRSTIFIDIVIEKTMNGSMYRMYGAYTDPAMDVKHALATIAMSLFREGLIPIAMAASSLLRMARRKNPNLDLAM